MHRVYYVLTVALVITACEQKANENVTLVALSAEGQPLVSLTLGNPVCDNVPEPECLDDWNSAREAFDSCYTACDLRRPCDDDDLDCLACYQQCPANPGSVPDCPTISINAECTDCADDLYDRVKTCTIPQIFPTGSTGTISIVVPCEQAAWDEVGECGICRAQALAEPQIGKRHCTCPSPTGTSWTNICRIPVEVPKLVNFR